MGTISEKLTYLNGTKQLLKDKINNLGGSIDDNTTFRQYANQLQNVYDNLPKTEYQEGTEITLSNTLKGKLDFENGVVGIGQSSQDSTNGYQLLNLTTSIITNRTNQGTTTEIVNQKVKLTGTCSASSGNRFFTSDDNNKVLFPAGNYTFSTNHQEGISLQFRKTTSGVATLGGTSSFTFTLDVDSYLYNGIIKVTNGATYNEEIYLMLEKGTTAHDYEQYTGGQASPNPSYSQTINSVTGNQDVVVSGKNYVDISSKIENAIINSNSIASGVFTLLYKRLKAGNYTISSSTNMQFVYCFTDDVPTTSTTNISRVVINSTSNTTFNVPKDCYICYRILFYDGSTLESSVDLVKINSEVQLEQGSTATTYEPYITPTSYQLSLGDKKLFDECTIVGSPDNWKYVEYYEKYTMTGEETISMQNQNTRFGFDLPSASTDTTKANQILAKSNYFSGVSFNNRNTSINSVFQICNGVAHSIQFNTGTMFADKTEFKNWVIANHPYIVYLRETPIETPITDETLISQLNAWYNAHSLNGTTIITSNGNLPMIIKVRGLKGE